jgi:hypothetical protein
MAAITIKSKLADLDVIFNKLTNVYYSSTENLTPKTITEFDVEFPVLSDGVTFDTGAPDITRVKLTTGSTWTSLADAGDADIQFQVASIANVINRIFLNVGTEDAEATINELDGNLYEGYGYNIDPKKVTGSLLLVSEDKETAVLLTKVEGYGSLITEQGKPAYFNTQWTPLKDNGVALYILQKKAATQA